MSNDKRPEYIFETSWEVCNQVGGIYTVLSTRAKTLQASYKDKLMFIGPDFWQQQESPYFSESASLLKEWKAYTYQKTGISIRVGRWDIPGTPIAVLIDFTPFLQPEFLHPIYAQVWDAFGVDSIAAYGDYDEAAVFGTLSGMVIESYYQFNQLPTDTKVIAHFNEWMTTFGLFYLKQRLPQVATVFTTHATSIGRSICGNGKPLYGYLSGYSGDQMARELNMSAKHSAEKVAAHIADCFTTVSDVTAVECKQLLEKAVDVVTPNGFENGFVPTGKKFTAGRTTARKTLKDVSEALLGYSLSEDVVFVGTCGRYEYRNKGIDGFIDSLKRLSDSSLLGREVVAFIMVPAFIKGARKDLQVKLQEKNTHPLPNNFITHELVDSWNDPVTAALHWVQMQQNKPQDKVKIIFVPSYLNGNDGIFNLPYYELLIGLDITAFPSYYEPWGYTPLESIAFSIPTITTNLSGFGQWVDKTLQSANDSLTNGVAVVKRTDDNYQEMVDEMTQLLLEFCLKTEAQVDSIRKAAFDLSQKALWKEFIVFYEETYTFALSKNKQITKLK